MKFPTKIQLIQRKDGFQFYVNVPAALAVALDLSKGEIAQWSIVDKKHLVLTRALNPDSLQEVKKKLLNKA
jgi:hypothetical protein